MKRPLIVLIALAAVAAVVAGVLLVVRDGEGASDDSPAAQAIQPTGEQAPDGLQRFYDQKLTWKGCGGDSECATITVPIDYDEPDGATTTLKAARYLEQLAWLHMSLNRLHGWDWGTAWKLLGIPEDADT